MADLYPYQEEAAEVMSREARKYLADDPGLGKTRTTLRAAQLAGARRVAVICPAVVRPHWHREWASMGLAAGGPVMSYNAVVGSALARDELRTFKPDVLILDEAHYLKSPTSKRTKLLVGTGGIAHGVPQVWPLSGTPMPRNPLELHPILAGLWPKALAELGLLDRWRYLNHFCFWRKTDFGLKVYAARNVGELRELLRPLMIRRRVQDVLPDLPELRWGTVTIALDGPNQKRAIDAEESLGEMGRVIREQGVLPPFLSDNLARYRHAIGDLKAPIAAKLLAEELEDNDEKRIVFAYHRSVLDTLKRELSLKGYGVAYIDGSTSPLDRERAIRVFQGVDSCRVFLGQIDACSVGITLTASHDVVIVEPSWNADVNVQAAKRAHRIGQRDSVLARFIQLDGTLDEAITAQHRREVQMVGSVVDHAE